MTTLETWGARKRRKGGKRRSKISSSPCDPGRPQDAYLFATAAQYCTAGSNKPLRRGISPTYIHTPVLCPRVIRPDHVSLEENHINTVSQCTR